MALVLSSRQHQGLDIINQFRGVTIQFLSRKFRVSVICCRHRGYQDCFNFISLIWITDLKSRKVIPEIIITRVRFKSMLAQTFRKVLSRFTNVIGLVISVKNINSRLAQMFIEELSSLFHVKQRTWPHSKELLDHPFSFAVICHFFAWEPLAALCPFLTGYERKEITFALLSIATLELQTITVPKRMGVVPFSRLYTLSPGLP
jgi:hypothetical protein